MSNEKNKIEALLFASAKRMNIEEISNITGIRDIDKIKSALNELKAEYEEKGSSMIIANDGDIWKLTVKDHYMPMVQKVVSQTELDRPLMQTLAVVAWKYPVVQADVVKIRHNKAYDHLKQLEEMQFITRQRFGRTNKITLTQKFFEYFDLPTKEQAREVFKNIVPDKVKEQVEKTEKEIEEGEQKIEDYERKKEEIEEQRRKEKEEAKQESEKKEEIQLPGEENVETTNDASEVSEVQKQDEVSEPEPRSERKE